MTSGLKIILIFITIITLKLYSIKCLDFCESFTSNGNTFDYGYQRNDTQYYYLFIAQNYWQLSVNESAKTVRLLPESRQSQWFGDQYWAAIRGDFNNQNDTLVTLTGFIQKNYTIDWALVEVDPITNDLILVNNGMQRRSQLSFGQDFEPSMGFDYGTFIQHMPCSNHSNSSVNGFLRTFRSLDFDAITFEASNDTQFIERIKTRMIKANISYSTDVNLVNNIWDRYEAVAVFTTSEGIFFLLKDSTRILYCFANQYFATLGCKTQPNILFDCNLNNNSIE